VARDGAQVLYGGCDAVVPTPYSPFAEALADLIGEAGRDGRQSALDQRARDELARLLPAAPDAAGGGSLSTLMAADSDAERHRLHAAVTDLLTTAGARAPVLLVLEDLHWADMSTLLLLRHLARSATGARMLVAATFRDVEADMPPALTETLAELARDEGVIRQRLGGLGDDEVADFLRLAAGVEPDDEATKEIAALTDGNAFLVTELWRELAGSELVEITPTHLRLARPLADVATPQTVREVVSQRVARLDPTTARMLELGAVAGPAFELDTLRRAADVEEAVLLDAVDEVVRSGLLVESPGRGLGYRFAHELVRRSVIDRVSASRRAELHLRVARALESTYGSDPTSRLAVLAHHYAEAAPIGDREVAVSYSLQAAESAVASLAFDEAVGHLRTALELGIGDLGKRATVDLALGYVCHRAGRSLDALDAFRDAATIARELGDADVLARAAIGFEEACWRPAIRSKDAIPLLEEAAEAIGPSPSVLRVRLLGALTRALDVRGEFARAMPARDEATAMARALGDRAALGWVLASAFWARGARSDVEVKALLAEALAIGEELDDAEIRTEAASWLVPSNVALCDHEAAHEMLARLFEWAAQLNEPFWLHVAEQYTSALTLCAGDLELAEAAARRSHEWSRLLRGRDASGVYGIQMFGIRREQGRLAELAPAVRMIAGRDGRGAWAPALAVVLADLGMTDEAGRELARVRADGLDAERATLWLATLAYLTDAVAVVGDEDLAAELYEALLPYRGQSIQIGQLVACLGSADRHLGMLAATLGEWERAGEHFERACALNGSIGAETWLAHTLLEHARMLLHRGGVGDRARASALLREAVRMAEPLGLAAVLARVRALGTAVESPGAAPDGLSPREVEILGLVAQGLSNREVGTRLHISEHTAANHVRSILRKTGCSNRTEATGYAHRRGLVPA
jgi:DNA-binding CsgD family transcriptional regulator